MRTSYGQIASNGNPVNSGTSDWKSIRGEEGGAYQIIFNPPFITKPVVVVSGGDSNNITTVVETLPNSFKVESRQVIRPNSGDEPPLEPGPVSFIAISLS